MPSSRRALQVTDRYREKVRLLRGVGQRTVQRHWSLLNPDDLDRTGSHFAEVTATALTEVQRAAARLSGAYVAGFVAVELRQHPQHPQTDGPVGVSRAGKSLAEALAGTVPAIKSSIATGTAMDVAVAAALASATRNAGEDAAYTARSALTDAMTAEDRIVGWQRVTSGGCGACLALADGELMPDDTDIEVHDFCACSAEPVVAGATNDVARPTGREMFDGMPKDQQDQALGPAVAQLVRDGQVPFHDLIGRSPMDAMPDMVTQAPVGVLKHA